MCACQHKSFLNPFWGRVLLRSFQSQNRFFFRISEVEASSSPSLIGKDGLLILLASEFNTATYLL